MRSTKPIKLIIYALLISSAFNTRNALAQKINLDDVAKIELTTIGSWVSRNYRKVEVVPENNSWNSYQTRLHIYIDPKTKGPINDSTRTRIRSIPSAMLDQLLTAISKPDNPLKAEQFTFNIKELTSYIDTVAPQLLPKQKASFIKMLNSKDIMQERLEKVIDPLGGDDRTLYQIKITTKQNKKDSIEAYTFSAMYHLPWRSNHLTSYNPAITELFETICGNDQYPKTEKAKLYKAIDKIIYEKYFEPKINWDNYKKEHPTVRSHISKTLFPVRFFKNNWGFFGYFSSTKLPSQILIKLDFPSTDTLSTENNKFEQRLINTFKKGNFFFEKDTTNPDLALITDFGTLSEQSFNNLEKRYPELAKFDRKQILIFTRLGHYNDAGLSSNISKWLLLPDNTSILFSYDGKILKDQNQKFAGTIDDRFQTRKTVCIVFDSSGKQIAGNDDPVFLQEN